MSQSYPIWNKIQACIYKASKCYGVKNDGLNEILIGTSAKNSHSFVRTRVTHKKHDDGTRTYHFYIDDKLYKKATLKKKDNKPLIELVDRHTPQGTFIIKDDFVKELADFFESDNPNFHRGKFIHACFSY